MKRKVRIYKDPNGNGGYINKTAQWLRKAQDGAQVGMTPVTAGIMQQMQSMTPQQMQQQSAQGQEEDVVLQETTQMISRGMDKEDIKAQLLAKYGNYEEGTPEYADAEAQIDQYLETVYDQLGENAREETNENLGMEDIDEYQAVEEVPENEPNYYYDLAEEDSADSDIEEDYSFGNLKYGGIPNKRSFINKTIRGLKKAQQGDQVEGENVANVRGTEDNPTGTTGNKNMFIAGVKGQAQDHFLKKQAEEMYNNQFGQGMPQPQADMDYAQFGGMRMRRANRKLFGTPFTPPGVTSSKYSFGPLGGVRSAEVQFNPLMMVSMFPMMSFPGMGGFSSYSYMTPKKKYTTGRLVTEKISNAVNKESIKDVAKATESDAANNAVGPCTEAEVKDPNNKRCYDPMYSGLGPRAINEVPSQVTTSPSEKVITEKIETPVTSNTKKDKWGRPEGDKWFGFDPTSKIYVQGPNKGKTSSEVKAAETAKIKAEQSALRKNIEQILPTALKYDPTGKIPKEAVDWAQERVTQKKPYGMDEKKWKEYQKLYANKKQAGGIINSPQQDQFGNLQKFIYGGDEMDQIFLEDLYQPPINQSDLDDTNSKDVTDAYFKHGGLHRYAEGDEVDEPKTYTKEELDKILADKQKSWETDYQTKAKQQQQQQMQQMQQYMNPMGSYNYGYRGSPMFGASSYSPGLLGAAGRLAGSFIGGRQSQFTPVGNPLQYAATAAGITQSGMLPTGMKYSKEKAEGFLGKLGLKKDKVWTIDYATPEQIKAGVKPGTTPGAAPGMAGSQQGKSGTRLRDAGMNLRERFLNRNTPAEADAEAFTGTLTGSTETQGPSKSAEQELKRFQENQKAKGLILDPKTQKWVPETTFMPGDFGDGSDETFEPPVPTVKPNAPVVNSNTSNVSAGTSINGMVESPGMVGKTPEEIKEAYRKGESIPTVVNKGNTTYINAAGEPIDLNDPIYSDTYAYGGYIPNYMAYGGYIPMADLGINFSPVSYGPNSITQPGGIGQGQTGPCTEEEVKDPNSPCYDPMYAGLGPRVPDTPQTAQLKFKEEKGPAGQKAANILGSTLDFGALLADDMNYFTENRTKYIPGMTEFARGEKQSANERIEKGQWNARTGKEGIQGFEGVIKKGGSIKSKKSNASGHKIDMNDFQSLLKLAGLI